MSHCPLCSHCNCTNPCKDFLEEWATILSGSFSWENPTTEAPDWLKIILDSAHYLPASASLTTRLDTQKNGPDPL